MLAKELLSVNFPVLEYTDTGIKALNQMEMLKISHLPVVSKGNLISVISDNDIYDLEIGEKTIKNFQLPLYKPFVNENQHIYEIIAIASKYNLTTVPVLDEENKFVGTITIHELTNNIANMLAANKQGGIIELKMPFNDYSATHISNIVENNNLKILSMYVSEIEDSRDIKVTLKINSNDISTLIQSFERFNYDINPFFFNKDKDEIFYNERLDSLLNFIDL